MRKALLSTLPLLIAIAGCNSGSSTPPPSTTPTSTTGSPAGKPVGTTTGSSPSNPGGLADLVIKDSAPGKGPAAAEGDTVWVTYVGKLMDGTIFDSSERSGGRPYMVGIGAGQVIKGWEQGLVGAKVGTKRELRIPYKLAYGETGKEPSIPPKADLVFDIDVLALVKRGEEGMIDATDLKVGTGPVVKKGSTITVNYKVSMVNGVEVDSTAKTKKSVEIKVGEGRTFPGIDVGVVGMKKGGKRRLFLPPTMGMPSGSDTVPPMSPLFVEIEVVGVK